jgi:two-component system chemotaxis response regulator CheB
MVAMAASTGGPAALTRILVDLPSDIQAAIAIVQHMPMKFTAAFAERLDSLCQIKVKEAAFAEPLLQGTAYVAPGQSCLEVRKGDIGFTIHAGAPLGNERYLPSADSLFASAAIAMGPDAMAVILTGMGDDGAKGAQAIAAAGGIAVAEDESTAIIPGMPRAAVLSGCVTRIAPLDKLADIIKDFARK